MYEVVIDNLIFTLYDNDYYYDIDVSNYYNKTIIQDLKCLLYFDLNKLNRNKEFDINYLLRDKIICNFDFSKYIGKDILLKTEVNLFDRIKDTKEYVKNGKHVIVDLGCFHVIDNNTIRPVIVNNLDDCLFELIEKHNVNNYSGIWVNFDDKKYLKSYVEDYYDFDKASIIKKYIYNGLLELYYRMLVEEAKLNNLNRVEGKATAMCSYLATKKVFNDFFDRNGYDLEVSNPNVFIKNTNIEYDAIIIKKNKNNVNKFIFDEKDVEAIIELKTSGCFISKNDLKNGEFIKYIKDSNPLDKKFIYLSLYESFGDRDTSVHYYEYLLCNLATIKNSFGIFCATRKNQKNLLIPYEYDLDKILKKIFN